MQGRGQPLTVVVADAIVAIGNEEFQRLSACEIDLIADFRAGFKHWRAVEFLAVGFDDKAAGATRAGNEAAGAIERLPLAAELVDEFRFRMGENSECVELFSCCEDEGLVRLAIVEDTAVAAGCFGSGGVAESYGWGAIWDFIRSGKRALGSLGCREAIGNFLEVWFLGDEIWGDSLASFERIKKWLKGE